MIRDRADCPECGASDRAEIVSKTLHVTVLRCLTCGAMFAED